MKTTISLWIAILTLFLGCKSSRKNNDPSGTYSAHFANEFYDTNDTVSISIYSENPLIYTIERHTGFRKIKEGASAKKLYKQTTSKMTYNEEDRMLEEDPLGKRIRYVPEKSVILVGTTEYNLIK